jgi:hypothetical protein
MVTMPAASPGASAEVSTPTFCTTIWLPSQVVSAWVTIIWVVAPSCAEIGAKISRRRPAPKVGRQTRSPGSVSSTWRIICST